MRTSSSAHLDWLADGILKNHRRSRWVEPTLRRETTDEVVTDELQTGKPTEEEEPIFAFNGPLEALAGTNAVAATTHFIVGPAGQGKSRLAAECRPSALVGQNELIS